MELANAFPKTLVVDDDKVTRELIGGILRSEGYPTTMAGSGEEALEVLKDEAFAIIFSDVNMLEIDGLTLLTHVRELVPMPVMILLTGYGSLEGAVSAIQNGAFDYISKPLNPTQLKKMVGRAAQHWKMKNLPSVTAPKTLPRNLIGKSPSIVSVYKTVAKATLASSNVLIFGESGTGKELIARAIHSHSSRSPHRFVTVNCGALTETLLESELFGHVKGSFTGAIQNKKGLFEEADGGTLFLDEIGDVTPALQVKLLRVIQEGEFKPVGSTETRKVDPRIITATHRDLDNLVSEGKFREDLYYRLKVIRINLPPLRERMEDLPELIEYFLARYTLSGGRRQNLRVSDEAMDLLFRYAWPGNIRELEHAIEQAVAMSNGDVLYTDDFPPEISASAPLATLPIIKEDEVEGISKSLQEMEHAHIIRILHAANFNKSRAASILGIDRATLYRKAQRYGISLDDDKMFS